MLLDGGVGEEVVGPVAVGRGAGRGEWRGAVAVVHRHEGDGLVAVFPGVGLCLGMRLVGAAGVVGEKTGWPGGCEELVALGG